MTNFCSPEVVSIFLVLYVDVKKMHDLISLSIQSHIQRSRKFYRYDFGSDRSPRRGDVVYRSTPHFCRSSPLKWCLNGVSKSGCPRGGAHEGVLKRGCSRGSAHKGECSQGGAQEGVLKRGCSSKHTSKHASKQAHKQVSRQVGKQATKQASKQAVKQSST